MLLDDFLSLFIGIGAVTKEKVEEVTDLLVNKGNMQREEARRVAANLVQKGREEKDACFNYLQQRMDSWKDMVVTREDFQRLEAKVDELLLHYKDRNSGPS